MTFQTVQKKQQEKLRVGKGKHVCLNEYSKAVWSIKHWKSYDEHIVYFHILLMR